MFKCSNCTSWYSYEPFYSTMFGYTVLASNAHCTILHLNVQMHHFAAQCFDPPFKTPLFRRSILHPIFWSHLSVFKCSDAPFYISIFICTILKAGCLDTYFTSKCSDTPFYITMLIWTILQYHVWMHLSAL